MGVLRDWFLRWRVWWRKPNVSPAQLQDPIVPPSSQPPQVSEPKEPPPNHQIVATPAPEPANASPTQTKPASSPRSRKETGNEFYFKRDILDELDNYRRYFKRLKIADADTYALYAKIGVPLMPQSDLKWLNRHELEPFIRAKRPAFGAMAFVNRADEEVQPDGDLLAPPKFLYFYKYSKRPAFMELPRKGDDLYLVTAYFDFSTFLDRSTGRWMKSGAPVQYPVAIQADGSVRVLRLRRTGYQVIRHRRGADRDTVSQIPSHQWGIPDYLKDWAAQRQTETDLFLANVFRMVANASQALQLTMIRVHCSKGGVTACFAVDPRRMPYFFQDREMTVGPTGARRRIFHMVRVHDRKIAGSNQRRAVRMHFRGEREFLWNGYQVRITVPVRDHLALPEFDVGAVDISEDPNPPPGIDMGELGDMFAENLTGKSMVQIWQEHRQP